MQCRRLDSPLYAHLLEAAAGDVEAAGPALDVLAGHEDDPVSSALSLRFMGAVHRLVLEGHAPELAVHYPSAGGAVDAGDPWPAFRATLEAQREALRSLLERPVQTNEVGRSAALLGGFLLMSQETGLPLAVLELGTSAGLNLRWDHFRFESRDAAWGDAGSPVRFTGVFDDPTPPLGVPARVVERAGCDAAPLDPGSPRDRLTLESYLWPDQAARLSLLRNALALALRVPATVERADAAEWLESRLAGRTSGAATVVFHSIVMQYVGEAGRARIRFAMEEGGRRATAAAPLAWLRMEPAGDVADVRLTTWPGGLERRIARSGYHGRPVTWLAR